MDRERDGLSLVSKECQCPDWVIRCFHWDGRWYNLHQVNMTGDYHTCTGPEPVERYIQGFKAHKSQFLAGAMGHPSLDDALCEFKEIEARVLGRSLERST